MFLNRSLPFCAAAAAAYSMAFITCFCTPDACICYTRLAYIFIVRTITEPTAAAATAITTKPNRTGHNYTRHIFLQCTIA